MSKGKRSTLVRAGGRRVKRLIQTLRDEIAGADVCPKHQEPLRDRPKRLDGVAYGAIEFYCESCEQHKPPVEPKVGRKPVKLIQCFCFSCGDTFSAEPPPVGTPTPKYCRKTKCQRAARAAGLPIRKDKTA